MHNFENSHKRFPSGGQGTRFPLDIPATKASTTFDMHSFFGYILPHVEQGNIASRLNLKIPYTDSTENQAAAKNAIEVFLCPSDQFRESPIDSEGYGATDYGATYYTDLDPQTGQKNSLARAEGALVTGGTPGKKITDGLSQTIAISEDVGRREEYNGVVMATEYVDTHGDLRKFWRWAEPDNAFGVSKPINNNSTPLGGPDTCRWTANNCGPNDEMFGFHPGGVNVAFCDGHVTFLREDLDTRIQRRLITRSDGDIVDDSDL